MLRQHHRIAWRLFESLICKGVPLGGSARALYESVPPVMIHWSRSDWIAPSRGGRISWQLSRVSTLPLRHAEYQRVAARVPHQRSHSCEQSPASDHGEGIWPHESTAPAIKAVRVDTIWRDISRALLFSCKEIFAVAKIIRLDFDPQASELNVQETIPTLGDQRFDAQACHR